jgi:hypothetical protein
VVVLWPGDSLVEIHQGISPITRARFDKTEGEEEEDVQQNSECLSFMLNFLGYKFGITMTFKKDELYHDQTPGLKDFGRQNVDFLEGEPTSKVPEKLGTGKSENQENVVTNDFLDTFS